MGTIKDANFAKRGLVASVLGIQASVSAWIACYSPSIDRIDGFVHAIGWALESGATAILLIDAATAPNERPLDESWLQSMALVLAVIAMALPLAKRVSVSMTGIAWTMPTPEASPCSFFLAEASCLA